MRQIVLDTETTGLSVISDKLCLCQVGNSRGEVWLVKFDGSTYSAPNLKKLLENPRILKIFHYARFDLAQLRLTAKSPGIRSPREHARLMSNLVKGWPTLDVLPDDGVPITRFADRLVMRAALCAADGSACPAPVVAKGCP